MHELIHLRRGDLWLNLLQTLLQILYWWHPLLWLANARIRRTREEAVDDAVMLNLRDEAETYAPTLIEVAKLSLSPPLSTMGLVGILESQSSLARRIERLIDFHPPRKSGLTLGSLASVTAFAALALPMGQAPAPLGSASPDAVQTVAPPTDDAATRGQGRKEFDAPNRQAPGRTASCFMKWASLPRLRPRSPELSNKTPKTSPPITTLTWSAKPGSTPRQKYHRRCLSLIPMPAPIMLSPAAAASAS